LRKKFGKFVIELVWVSGDCLHRHTLGSRSFERRSGPLCEPFELHLRLCQIAQAERHNREDAANDHS
jgi:hypothetical protein